MEPQRWAKTASFYIGKGISAEFLFCLKKDATTDSVEPGQTFRPFRDNWRKHPVRYRLTFHCGIKRKNDTKIPATSAGFDGSRRRGPWRLAQFLQQ